jgi:hypothetical protein
MRSRPRARLVLLTIAIAGVLLRPGNASRAAGGEASQSAARDRDLLELNIPQLHRLYAGHKYTVTQVVQWHLARIAKYNGTYRAIEHVDEAGALKTAAREDADARAGGIGFHAPSDVGRADCHQGEHEH